jgi:hypothetical protein
MKGHLPSSDNAMAQSRALAGIRTSVANQSTCTAWLAYQRRAQHESLTASCFLERRGASPIEVIQ